MYVVVGCSSCRELWIRESGGKQTTCPGCRRTHDTAKLRALFESDDIDAARDARTRLLAARSDEDDVASFSELAEEAAESLREDPDELVAFGLDPDEIEAAATDETEQRDRQQIVTDAIAETDPPTEAHIVAAAAADGVPPETARSLLEKLREEGRITVTGGRHRLL